MHMRAAPAISWVFAALLALCSAPIPQVIGATVYKNYWNGTQYLDETAFLQSNPFGTNCSELIVVGFGRGKKEGKWGKQREAVRRTAQRAWRAYANDAFGFDEYLPLKGSGTNLGSRGIGFFIVDSLDTLYLMELADEYNQARRWVETELDFSRVSGTISTFELTIRVLGGLLSAYAVTGDELFIRQARELGDRIVKVLSPESGFPAGTINLSDPTPGGVDDELWAAEVGTMQLELRYLAFAANDLKFWNAAEKIGRNLSIALRKAKGAATQGMNGKDISFDGGITSLGGRADSYYEYLIKQYLLTNKSQPEYLYDYRLAVDVVHQSIVGKTNTTGLLFVGKYGGRLLAELEHLACFASAMLLLGINSGESLVGKKSWSIVEMRDYILAHGLTETCWQMYARSETKMSSESVSFSGFTSANITAILENRPRDSSILTDADRILGTKPVDFKLEKEDYNHPVEMQIPIGEEWNILRPEQLESLFYMWRMTKNERYREYAWAIFTAMEKGAKLSNNALSGLDDVTATNSTQRDKMETFFFAETLKYLYLIFSDDDVLPLDRFVFNTEAHPFPKFTPPESWL